MWVSTFEERLFRKGSWDLKRRILNALIFVIISYYPSFTAIIVC